MFTDALEVVGQELADHRSYGWCPKNAFHVQMAYLLLWTSIERYASLRYHLRSAAAAKVKKVAEEPAFAAMLKDVNPAPRCIQRADKPGERETLNPHDAKKSMDYYYQVRSNMVHRGKGMPSDHDIVTSSCSELLKIFRHVLESAEQEARE